MVISLLHPSRGRPEKSYRNAMDWINKSGCSVELIVSVDSSDKFCGSYAELYGAKCWSFDNDSVVQATNRAAIKSTGDILVYLSDDFKCPDNWGTQILKEFEGATGPRLIKVDDCLQKFDVPVLTIPIMNRALYERLGYFWHPGYKSMFVDEDLYWTAKKLNALKLCPQLKFPHEHPSNGKAENDETYKRSAANWNQGKALFQERRKSGFPL